MEVSVWFALLALFFAGGLTLGPAAMWVMSTSLCNVCHQPLRCNDFKSTRFCVAPVQFAVGNGKPCAVKF